MKDTLTLPPDPAAVPEHTSNPPVEAEAIFPVSFAQKRLWLLDQLEPNSPVYNLTMAAHLRGPLEVEVLRTALNALVARHEPLRTTLHVRDGEPVQVIAPESALELPVVDLSHLPEAERKQQTERQLQEEALKPFDLARDLMLRVKLLRLGPQEHILATVMHHIASDGWSIGIFFKELEAFYEACSRGQPSSLPALPVGYADFAVWQREWLQGEELERQLGYWKQQLAGAPALLELPADHARPSTMTHRGAKQPLAIPKSIYGALKTLAQQERCTVFMVLLGALQTLLFRYTGQTDIVIGSPIANRTRAEIEGLIGYFVNSLALRGDLSGNPTFRQLLRRVREVTLDAYGHQDFPFEQLVEALHPERNPSFTPVFQVMLALQNTPMPRPQVGPLQVVPFELDNGTTKFDLTVFLFETAEGLSGSLEYATDLFEAPRMRRMAGHFQALLEGIIINPDLPLAGLPLLTPAERRQLLREWNHTHADYLQHRCIHELFEAQAERHPEALAVACGPQRLSYGELNRRANQLGYYLRRLGIGPESLVGVCVERSADMLAGLLGILKAGGAYVPLDPNYPQERLAFMLKDANISVLLTQQKFVPALPAAARHVVCLDAPAFGSVLEDQPAANLPRAATPDNLAYVIYTSGSTGTPKGVQIQHRGVVNLITWHQQVYRLTPADRATQLASPAFDASVWELWPYLTCGASIHIPDEETRLSPRDLIAWLGENQITLCFVPTPLAEATLEGPWPDGLKLRAMLTGGDRLRRRPRKPLPFELINHYGPTEYTVVTTAGVVAPGPETAAAPAIGRPIANTQVYLLDPALQPVPIGVPGELHVGGAGLARGYLNRPELTAERFIPNPFSPDPQARLYKTGDLARYLENGDIEYLGRIDFQVKVRGYRIELGEIEAALGRHPAVREAVVIAQPAPGGENRLVAYVVPADDRQPTASSLRDFLKQKLPEYMVPSFFITLDALPLTPNGKVDRKALPAPDPSQLETARQFVAPRTPVEQQLAGIWCQVLRLKQVGIHDNFFELGGDSILSIQLISKATQAGLRLTPKQLFQNQTIAELAQVAGQSTAAAAEQGVVSGDVPLTPIQRWFFERDFAEPHHWNQAVLLELRQRLEPGLLEAILQQLVFHHDALRLRFRQDGTAWTQHNARAVPSIKPVCLDLSGLPADAPGPALDRAVAELQASLDLGEGPLIKAALVTGGADRPDRLLIVAHHLAIDGVSWRILLEDLQTAYEQSSRGESIRLPAKTTSFKAWAEQVTQYARSAPARNELAYWLKSAQPKTAPLPVDFAQGDNSEASARTVSVTLDKETTRALLQQVPQAYNTQITDVLLAALGRTLAWWTGQDAFLLHLEGHGREELFEQVDLSRTVGWFTALFPVRLEVPRQAALGDLLQSVKEQLRAVPNRGIGFGILRYLSGDEGIQAQLRALPEPEIAFNYLGQFDQALPESSPFVLLPDTPEPLHSPRAQRPQLLEINGGVIGGCLQLHWSYSANRHRPETLAQLAQRFSEELHALIQHCLSPRRPGRTVSDFPLAKLEQPTLDRLLQDWPGFEDVYPLAPMQQLFLALGGAASEVGFEQFCYTLRGPLDVTAFRQAWQQLVERHAIFRTGFVTEGRDEPLQVVHPRAELRCEQHDWRSLTAAQQAERLAVFLRADQQRGFDLARPPLMRLTLIHTGDDTLEFIWSFHHLLLDGWSWPLVWKEVSLMYNALRAGAAARLEPVRPYRDYIGWLQRQDLDAAREFWTRTLQGHEPHPLLAGAKRADRPAFREVEYQETQVQLKAETTAALQTWAREQRLTFNLLVEAAWALVVSHETGEPGVVFGRAVSGRPPELAGVESMIGLFINNLPRRVRVAPESPLAAWLRDLQQQQIEMRDHEFVSLAQIQQWSQQPWHTRLFDSLVVFQNYQTDGAEAFSFGAVQVVNSRAAVRTNYPVTLMGAPGSELQLKIIYDGRQVTTAAAIRYLKHLAMLLEQMAADPAGTLAALLDRLPAPERKAGAIRAAFALAQAPRGRKVVRPRDDLEAQLTTIWERVLGVQPIGVTDNFFALGGHSLPAVRLFQEIKEFCGKHLPMVTLFQAPTIEQLAQILRQDNWTAPWSSLVAIKASGTRPPFYCVHGVGGNILEYIDLARYMDEDQPFYGLQAVGLDGKRPWLPTVEEMAAHYITEIRAFQPVGPYHLGGSSYGGLVSYEIAQQLHAQGETVALLAFFDTWAPGHPKPLPTTSRLQQRLYYWRHRFGLHWSNLKVAQGRQRWDYVWTKAVKWEQGRIKKFRRLKMRLRKRVQWWLLPKEIRETREAGRRASYAYVPLPYPGRATLFRATEQPKGICLDPALGWSELVQGGLDIYDTPGHHGAIVRDPRARVLAEQLKECLHKVRQNR